MSWGPGGARGQDVDCCLEEVHLKEKEGRKLGLTHQGIWFRVLLKDTYGHIRPGRQGIEPPTDDSSLTLQPTASSACRTRIVRTVATAASLVSSRTTGQKVRTRREPDITMATRISVQRNHSNGMIHKTWR